VVVAAGGEADTDAVAWPFGEDGFEGEEEEFGAVVGCAAEVVGSVVAGVAEELIGELAVGGVEFDAVEPGEASEAGGDPVVVDDGGDFVAFEGAWGDAGLDAFVGSGGAAGVEGGRGDGEVGGGGGGGVGWLGWLEVGMGHSADVPELGDDGGALIGDGGGDGEPAVDVVLVEEAWGVGVALALLGDVGGFGDEEGEAAGAGALAVVVDHEGRGGAVAAGAAACEGRHEDAVGKGPGADGDGVEE
jgi:hypothetical protein